MMHRVLFLVLVTSLVSGAAAAKKKSKDDIAADAAATQEAADDAASLRAAELDAAAEVAAETLRVDAEKQAAAAAAEKERVANEALARARDAPRVEAKGIDARIRRMSDAVARDIKRLPGDWRDQIFAVTAFQEVGDETKVKQLGLVVSDLLVTNLARDHRLALTERRALAEVLNEQALSQLGITDGAKAAEIGRVAGARAIVLGEVTDLGNEFKVTTRVIDTETATVVAAADALLPKDELIALSANAVVLKSKSGAFFRSLVAPGWGQSYNGDDVKAGLVGGTVALLGVTTLGLLGTGVAMHILYQTYDPTALDDKSYQQGISELKGFQTAASALYIAGASMVVVTGAAWLTGAGEAWVSGVDVDSLDQALLRE